MHTSDEGIDLIKHFEGCKLTAYPDVGGRMTIGFGHTGPEAVAGHVLTPDQAESLLKQDIATAEAAVIELLGSKTITQGQFDALVSFVFNLGKKRLRRSTLLKMLLAGDIHGAADQFLRWAYVGGTFIPALARRRVEERTFFLAGLSDTRSQARSPSRSVS